MRKYLIFFSAFLFLTLSMTCQKKSTCIVGGKETEPVVEITYEKTDRNDVPPPPDTTWWTLDTTDLDYCQQRIWDYLKTMYPISEENYWDYNIYGIMDEPADIWENRAFVRRYTHFFIDTVYSVNGMLYDTAQPCINVDSTFFLQALGPPTCRTYHAGLKRVNYFYQFKLRYRHGPCPYIFDEGDKFEGRCTTLHFDYCALLMMHFSEETGRLIYISFYGSG